ncbi:hypothetical protein C8J57DRAFT_1508312 [Mycena rebaudengoi]|nr:hypothetical protein C8J57DRAFT_1508312 [Mycena rebaudengoi]
MLVALVLSPSTIAAAAFSARARHQVSKSAHPAPSYVNIPHNSSPQTFKSAPPQSPERLNPQDLNTPKLSKNLLTTRAICVYVIWTGLLFNLNVSSTWYTLTARIPRNRSILVKFSSSAQPSTSQIIPLKSLQALAERFKICRINGSYNIPPSTSYESSQRPLDSEMEPSNPSPAVVVLVYHIHVFFFISIE